MHSKLDIQKLLTFIRTQGQTKGVGLLVDIFPNMDRNTAEQVYFDKLRIVLLNKEYYFYPPKNNKD